MKVLAILLCLISLFARAPVAARAEDAAFAQVNSREAYLCRQPDERTALFCVPYTYFVEVLYQSDGWYKVRYAEDAGLYRAVEGFCKAENLTPTNITPRVTYLNKTVTVTYRADLPDSSLPVLGELNVTAAFYGAYTRGGAQYSYVLYDGSFGYIYGANDDFPLNEEVASQTEVKRDKEENNAPRIVAAVVITLIAAAALAVVFVTGRKPKARRE